MVLSIRHRVAENNERVSSSIWTGEGIIWLAKLFRMFVYLFPMVRVTIIPPHCAAMQTMFGQMGDIAKEYVLVLIKSPGKK